MTEYELKRIQHKIEPYVDFTDMFIIYQAIEKTISVKPMGHYEFISDRDYWYYVRR